MKKYKWLIIALNLFVLIAFINYSIVKKEGILSEGTLVLLELAPVDPRSLMQGDYMRLSYAIAQNIQDLDSISMRGYCVVKIDADGVAQKIRLQEEKTPVHTDEYLIPYTRSSWALNIGAESYFFQEGEADKYALAKYGGLKMDRAGNNVLEGLYDENKKRIE